jgi:hypothetical protein
LMSGGSGSCSFSQSASSSHSYDLYISGIYQASASGVSCGMPLASDCPDPSGWSSESGCTGAGCLWCSFLTPSCVTPGTYCPTGGGYNCVAQTSKSACDVQAGRCAWCPNSYNGGTNPNGGSCMNAPDLAGQCGGCYISQGYTYSTNYAMCSGICPTWTITAGTTYILYLSGSAIPFASKAQVAVAAHGAAELCT